MLASARFRRFTTLMKTDDKWSFRVKPKSGAKGYEDSGEIGNVFTGEHAVEEVDKVVDYVKRGWDKTK